MHTNTYQKGGQDEYHAFSVAEAREYGIEKAILLFNIRFWLKKNSANGKHIYEGFVWTYNSSTAFEILFPYLNNNSIRRWLIELENDGVLKSGNFNKAKYDKTKWYTIPAEFAVLNNRISENEQSIVQNEQPIPDINTDEIPLASDESDASLKGRGKKERKIEQEVDLDEGEEDTEFEDIKYDTDTDDSGEPLVNTFGRFKDGRSIIKKPPRAENKDATKIAVWFARKAAKETGVRVQVTGYTVIKKLLEQKNGLKADEIKKILEEHLDSGLPDYKTANIHLALSPQKINEYLTK